MQSVFCGTRNPLSYNGCKSSERQSPSEVGSVPNRPPLTALPAGGEGGGHFSKVPIKPNKCCAVFSRSLSLSLTLFPHVSFHFPTSGFRGVGASPPPPLPLLRRGRRESGGTDECGPGRRRLLRGDKGSRCGGRTLQEWLHLAVCRVFLVFISFTLHKLCCVVRGDVSPPVGGWVCACTRARLCVLMLANIMSF